MDIGGQWLQLGSSGSARRWKDILLRVYRGFFADRVLANAAGVTYYSLLAIFPGIAAVVSVFGLFADPHALASHLGTVSGVVPGGGIEVIRGELDRLAGQGKTTLGISFAVSLLLSLWFANSSMTALFDALNIVYDEKEKRSYLKFYATSLAVTVGFIGFLLLAIAFVIALPVALNFVGRSGLTGTILNVARWPLLFLVTAFALGLIYRFGPSRDEPRWQWISWGAAVAALLWLAASGLFSWYAANFGSFNKTYGSLGAVAGFMTWMWLSIIVVLVGGELNAAIEHQAEEPGRSDAQARRE